MKLSNGVYIKLNSQNKFAQRTIAAIFINFMKQQVQVFYSGRVQGVGFRFTCRDIVGELGVVGWVKNLSDGRVEVVAEGESRVLKNYLSRINQYFSRYIQDVDTQWFAATGELNDFGIKF